MNRYKYLFEPVTIGSMVVRNRIVVPPMGVGFGADDDGCPTEQLIEFLAERARGEPGMIIGGASYVHPTGTTHPSSPMKAIHLWDDRVLPGLKAMVEAVKRYEVRFGAQLNHGGMTYLPGPAICASAIPELTRYGLDLREATREQIIEIIEAFGAAADRCIRAGFDFLEIHAGHGYLIETFLTPFYNRRTDEYGGSFENRIRFLLEVVRRVSDSVGPQVPLGVRLNGEDFIPKGSWGMEDLCRLAPILENEGVAYLHITCGTSTYGTLNQCIAPMYVVQGDRARFSAEVKRHVSIPVITVGRIKSPDIADDIIREGKADLVALGRAHLADPDFTRKVREGRVDDIRPCLADCLGCIENILRYGEASCTVNPRIGREYLIRETEGDKKERSKRVLVVGSGPAGMEAARRSAFSGHRVMLCERRDHIGGQLAMAAGMPQRGEIGDIIPWYERQLRSLGVELRLKTEVDADFLDEISPDVMIVATGSVPAVPWGLVEGLENVESITVMMADELIEEKSEATGAVLIVGGDQIGLQLADHFSEKNVPVFLVERGNDFAAKMAQADRHYLMERLKEKRSHVVLKKRAEKVQILPPDEVWVTVDGERQKLPGIEMIVFAADRRPVRFLAEVADEKGIAVHITGDAQGVNGEGQGTIMAAIAAGYDAGRQI